MLNEISGQTRSQIWDPEIGLGLGVFFLDFIRNDFTVHARRDDFLLPFQTIHRAHFERMLGKEPSNVDSLATFDINAAIFVYKLSS